MGYGRLQLDSHDLLYLLRSKVKNENEAVVSKTKHFPPRVNSMLYF